jgi:ABC-type branched-subunit amino acid transport system substrate-binding protein
MRRNLIPKLLIPITLAVVFAVAMPMVTGCTGAGGPGETEPIKVGIASTITGVLQEDGRHHVRSMELARDEINAAGGILGRQVELEITDLGSYTPAELSAVRDTLKASDVDMVNYNWTVNPACSSYLMEVGVPVMHHGWVTVDWQEWYDNKDEMPYWYTLNQNEAGYGKPYFLALSNPEMITWDYPNKKAAILVSEFDYSIIQAQWWREEAEAAGWEIVLHEIHPVGTVEFGPQLTKIREENPAIVFFCSVISNEVIACYSDFIEDPTDSLFALTWGIEKPEFRGAFGDQANGVVGTLPGFFFHTSVYEGNNPAYQEHYRLGQHVRQEILDKHGEVPSVQGPIAYDSMYIWKEAVEAVGDPRDFEGIHEYIIGRSFVGACGTYTFDPDTQAGYYGADGIPCNYYQMQDGEPNNLAIGVGRDVELLSPFQTPWWLE